MVSCKSYLEILHITLGLYQTYPVWLLWISLNWLWINKNNVLDKLILTSLFHFYTVGVNHINIISYYYFYNHIL